MYLGHSLVAVAAFSVCLLSARVCLCVCVCIFLCVDSGALMLKDVSSFLHYAGLLWQPCWAALMSHVCHCKTFGDEDGVFTLSASPTLCRTLRHSLALLLVFCWEPLAYSLPLELFFVIEHAY